MSFTLKHYPIALLLFFAASFIACNTYEQEESSTLAQTIPAMLNRSEKLHKGEEWDNVQNTYVKQRELLKQNAEAQLPRLKLAQLFINEARITGEHGHYYPAALQMLNEILASESLDEDLKFVALSTKAGVQLSLHQFKNAFQTGRDALELNNYNAQIYGVLIDAYNELGMYEKAVQAADKMVSIRPDLRSYSRVSYLRELYGDLEGAIEAMEMAVQAGYPGFEETCWTRLNLGNLYLKKGEPAKAEEQYQLCLQERANYPFALAALAKLKVNQGDLATAESLLNEAISIIPEVGFYVELARIYQRTNKNAEPLIEEVLAMLTDDEQNGHIMHLEYAEVFLDLKKEPSNALEYALKEYQVRPNNISVNEMLAKIYQALGEEDLATQHFTYAQI